MGSLSELSEVVSVGIFVGFFMIFRPQLGKARAKLSQVGGSLGSNLGDGDLHMGGLLERGHSWSGTPKGKGRKWDEQREELGCDTVTTEVSANPVGSAEAGAD